MGTWDTTIHEHTSYIMPPRPFTDPHAGLIQNPRLCVCFQSDKVQYSWQHYFTTYAYAEGVCGGISDITIYLDQLLPSSGYVVIGGGSILNVRGPRSETIRARSARAKF